MFVPGQNGYQDNVTSFGYGSGNVATAKSILTAAGYKMSGSTLMDPSGKAVPALSMRENGEGKSRRAAEQEAARRMIDALSASDQPGSPLRS